MFETYPLSANSQRLGRIFEKHIAGLFFLISILNVEIFLDNNTNFKAIIQQDDHRCSRTFCFQQDWDLLHYAMPVG